MSDQEISKELTDFGRQFAENSLADLRTQLDNALKNRIELYKECAEGIVSVNLRVCSFVREAREALQSLESTLAATAANQMEAIGQLRQDLSKQLLDTADAASAGIDDMQASSISEFGDFRESVAGRIGELIEKTNSVGQTFSDMQASAVGLLDAFQAARKDILAVTSPLRETSGAAGDALKIATDTFNGVG